MTQNPFIPLKVHSAYSLAEGAIKIPDLLDASFNLGIPAVALTDTNNLFGAMEFSLSAVKKGIQPILGAVIPVESPFEQKNKHAVENAPKKIHELVFLVTSEQGYKNLIKIISRSYLTPHESPKPCTNFETLRAFSEGLIVLTGGIKGGIAQYLLEGEPDLAKAYLETLKELYQERLYTEIHRFGLEEESQTEEHLITLAYEYNIPLVATNEAFFLHEDQYQAHDVLLCIADGKYINQLDRRRVTPHHRLRSPEEMVHLFRDLPEAIQNTVLIAQRCHFILNPLNPRLPCFDTQKGEAQELKDQAIQGLEYRLQKQVLKPHLPPQEQQDLEKKYFDRLALEIEVINRMGYAGYYLIVAEFIQWAKNHNIPVGPGRGSGAGSLVAWALTITDVDPIRWNLIFERFLNPERVSMPDFDVDFCQDRRDEVIEHVCEKYGRDRVAQIITFGKLQARAVVRDVGRVLGMPYGQVDKLSKLIPSNPTNPVNLQEAINQEPEIGAMAEREPEIKNLLDIALQLEGLYRHASTHAAGVVIGGEPLENIVALYYDGKAALPATQFNMKYVEFAGLVKFDFLGLKTLTILQETVNLIKKHQGIEINLAEVPLDDKKTFELLQRVEAVGIFQLESAGMRDVLRKLQPQAFEEIIALVALYRPGPMDDIPRYIACRHGEETIRYAHPLMEESLKETYGVMVYQEQVMQIAQKLAGYSLGQADLLRRAMGKKIKSEMDAQQDIFIQGCIQHNGIKESVASQIFDQMAKFASYGFPKGHAAPYALISYQTAYLKANHPVEFLAAMMTYDRQNTDKLSLLREELHRLHIPLLPPDINRSFSKFSLEKLANGQMGIRYALAALKNVGEGAIDIITQEREENGPFKGIIDFVRRFESKILNKRLLESLIAAGAFDSLEHNRAKLYNALDTLSKHIGEKITQSNSLQHSLFHGTAQGGLSLPEVLLPETLDWTKFERAQYEFDAIGFYLSDHPVKSYQDILKQLRVKTYEELRQSPPKETTTVMLAGVVVSKKERLSKSGQKYAFVQFSDSSGLFEGVLFSDVFAASRDSLENGNVILLRAEARTEAEEIRLTIQNVQKLDDSFSTSSKILSCVVTHSKAFFPLKDLLATTEPGATAIQLTLRDDSYESVLTLKQKVKVTPRILDRLSSLPHVENIKVS